MKTAGSPEPTTESLVPVDAGGTSVGVGGVRLMEPVGVAPRYQARNTRVLLLFTIGSRAVTIKAGVSSRI